MEVHCLVAQLIGTIDTHGKIYEMIIIIRYVFYFIVLSQITEPVARLLKGKNFAYLSTLMKDGSSQVTPTWVDIDKDGNSILINTAEGRTKHKNVSRSKSSHFNI